MKKHNHAFNVESFDEIEDFSRQWSRVYQILGERVG